MSQLALRNVRKSFGAFEVLHGIDISIKDGEFLVLVGPSGCGKSTLLRCIAGLDGISSGDLLIDGTRINDMPPADRGVGMVFQSYALYPHMTVAENISFGLRIAGHKKDDIARRVRDVAETLQLTPLLERKPRALSGGQRQRVAIGRALVQEPNVFLFDEPLSNLDAKLRITMRVEIGRLHRRLKTTSVYVTHDQTEALTMADRIAVMNGGRFEQVGDPLTLYHRPATLFVAGFIGSPKMNLLPARIEAAGPESAQVAPVIGGSCTVQVDARDAAHGTPVLMGVRPEHIKLRAAPETGDRPSNALSGSVELAEHLGEQTFLHIAVAGLDELLVVKVPGTPRVAEGEAIALEAPAGDCHLFSEDTGAAFPRTVRDAALSPLLGKPG